MRNFSIIFMISLVTAISTACAPPGGDAELEAAQQSGRREGQESQSQENERKPAKADTEPTGAAQPPRKKVQLAKFNKPAETRVQSQSTGALKDTTQHRVRVWDPKPEPIPSTVLTKPAIVPAALKPMELDEEEVEVELGKTPKYNLPYNQELYAMGRAAQKDMSLVCGESPKKTTTVTHYYVPILKNFDPQACHYIEGVCHFQRKGITHVYNYGGGKPNPAKAVPLSVARCKSGIGYGIPQNCTHPCRSLAASTTHHKPGEVIFFKNLVGMRCGVGKYAMIHDGFMVVNDTGAKKHFNHTGRFDFFFGPCRKKKNGICLEGGWDLSKALTRSNYCRVWKPNNPGLNANLKEKIYTAMRDEGIAKGDDQYAANVNITQFIAYRTERGRR